MSIKRKIALIFAAVLITEALIYTRPMTLAQICGGIDISESHRVHGYYADSPDTVENVKFEINADDERLTEIIELFRNQKLRRSLWNFLPRGTRVHRWEDGDFKWDVMFNFENVTLPDGSGARGSVIHVSNFFELIEVHFDGDTIRCDMSGKQEWLKEVMDIIKEQK